MFMQALEGNTLSLIRTSIWECFMVSGKPFPSRPQSAIYLTLDFYMCLYNLISWIDFSWTVKKTPTIIKAIFLLVFPISFVFFYFLFSFLFSLSLPPTPRPSSPTPPPLKMLIWIKNNNRFHSNRNNVIDICSVSPHTSGFVFCCWIKISYCISYAFRLKCQRQQMTLSQRNSEEFFHETLLSTLLSLQL